MRKLLCLAFLLFPIAASAGHLGDNTKINKIRLNDGYAIVYTEAPIAKASCATTDTGVVVVLEDTNYGSRKYATLLTALTASREFNPWCPDECMQVWDIQFTKCYTTDIE